MKIRVLAPALAAILALLAAVPAVAGTNKMSGTLMSAGGSAYGKITFKIKTNKKGVATKVTSVKIRDVASTCLSGDTGATPGPTFTTKLPGTFKVKKGKVGGKTTYFFGGTKKAAGFRWNVSGYLKTKKGKKVNSGSVQGGSANRNASPECTATAYFDAKKK